MALDRPRHGYEGMSNGGEIWGSSSSRINSEDMIEQADRINRMLDSIKLEDDLDINNSKVESNNIFGEAYLDDKKKTIDSLKNNLDSIFGGGASIEERADAMIQAMENNMLGVNGQPIVESQEKAKVLIKNQNKGFAKFSLLALFTAIISIGIIILGTLLRWGVLWNFL